MALYSVVLNIYIKIIYIVLLFSVVSKAVNEEGRIIDKCSYIPQLFKRVCGEDERLCRPIYHILRHFV